MLRSITINPVLNGFVVNFGCQQLAYTDTTKMLGDLGDYLREPEETEKKLLAKECFNRRHTLGMDTLPPPPCPDTAPRTAADVCATGVRPMGMMAAGTQLGGKAVPTPTNPSGW